MNHVRFKRTLLLMVSTAAVASLATYLMSRVERAPLVHDLESPLVLQGDSLHHPLLLPAGTRLYFDRAFPEGFVRYKVYVNVEGIKLECMRPAKSS